MKRVSPFFLLTSLLVLSACVSPNWVPKSYTYQDSTPLSSPAPSAPWYSKIHFNAARHTQYESLWRSIAQVVHDKIVARNPAGTVISLRQEGVLIPQEESLDHFLRQALLQSGYTFTSDPKAPIVTFFDIEPLREQQAKKLIKKTPGLVVAGLVDGLVGDADSKASMSDMPFYAVHLYAKEAKHLKRSVLNNVKPVWEDRLLIRLPRTLTNAHTYPSVGAAPPVVDENKVSNPAVYFNH